MNGEINKQMKSDLQRNKEIKHNRRVKIEKTIDGWNVLPISKVGSPTLKLEFSIFNLIKAWDWRQEGANQVVCDWFAFRETDRQAVEIVIVSLARLLAFSPPQTTIIVITSWPNDTCFTWLDSLQLTGLAWAWLYRRYGISFARQFEKKGQ